jgi:hypothetical protein
VPGRWRKHVHNAYLHFNTSPNIPGEIKSRAVSSTCSTREQLETHTTFWSEKLQGRHGGVERRIILKRILEKQGSEDVS